MGPSRSSWTDEGSRGRGKALCIPVGAFPRASYACLPQGFLERVSGWRASPPPANKSSDKLTARTAFVLAQPQSHGVNLVSRCRATVAWM